MGFWIGRALQLLAMIILPVGLLIGTVRGDIRLEVNLLAVGGAMFIVGWLLTRGAEK
jgi:hypothetical protein